MDEVFGRKNLRNEIIWKDVSPSRATVNMDRNHRYILFYRKATPSL